MRRIVITGLIIFSALTLSWVGGASGQRVREVAAATTRTPTQVEVTNFPAVQGVNGMVNVGNLPLDADGNLKCAVQIVVQRIGFQAFQEYPAVRVHDALGCAGGS